MPQGMKLIADDFLAVSLWNVSILYRSKGKNILRHGCQSLPNTPLYGISHDNLILY